jgi:hypothetical protein
LQGITFPGHRSRHLEFRRSAAIVKSKKGCLARIARQAALSYCRHAKEKTKMSTPAQITANQANAKLSTGPTSEAGRKIVSANSVKHGFCAKVHTLLPGEEEPFAQHLEGYIKTYAPVGAPEEDLVRSLADSNWRLTKINALERTLFIRLETAEPEAFEDTLKELRRTSTYGNKTQRTIEKTRSALKEMQSARRSAYDKAQEEAILLTQLAHAKGQPPDQSKEFPSPELCGGFVYALPEIARLIARAARLEEAKALFVGQAS